MQEFGKEHTISVDRKTELDTEKQYIITVSKISAPKMPNIDLIKKLRLFSLHAI